MEDQADVVFVLIVSALGMIFIAFLSWTRRHFSAKRKREIQETIRLAFQQGQQLTPETVRAIAMGEDASRNDLRWGIILLAVALGLVIFGGVSSFLPGDDYGEGANWLFIAIAAFPGCLGVAFLFLHADNRRKNDIDE